LVVVLTEVSKPFGWSLFSGDASMRVLFILVLAGAFYLVAAIVAAFVTLLRGRRKEPS
jgi:hypothetical protein